jgi:hypothetical protein
MISKDQSAQYRKEHVVAIKDKRMDERDWIQLNAIQIPPGFVEAVKGVSAMGGFPSWRKQYLSASTIPDKLDLLAETEAAYKLNKHGCLVEFHPVMQTSRGPDLEVKWKYLFSASNSVAVSFSGPLIR